MNEIFVESLKKVIENYFWIVLTVWAFVFLTGLWYCFIRAGTANFIRSRIWNFFSDSNQLVTDRLSSIWGEVSDVENFRFKTGMDFKSTDQIDDFFKFIEEKNIPKYEVLRVANYFSVEKKEFIKIDYFKKSRIRLGVMFFFSVILVVSNIVYGFVKDNAYLTIKDTNYSFVLKGESALAYNTVFNKEKCDEFFKSEDDYTKKKNMKIICSIFNAEKKEAEGLYNSTLNKQRNVFLFLFFILIFIIFYFAKSAYNYAQADLFMNKYSI